MPPRTTMNDRITDGQEDAGLINGDTPESDRPLGGENDLVLSADDFLEGHVISSEEEFRAKFPLTSAAMDAWKEKGVFGNPVLRVVSRIHGFRRGGIAHSAEQTDHLMIGLTAPKVEAILADPQLIAEII